MFHVSKSWYYNLFSKNMSKETTDLLPECDLQCCMSLTCIVLKKNQGYASISIDVTSPEKKSRHVSETFRVDNLFKPALH